MPLDSAEFDPKHSQGLLFLDETGTPDYLNERKLAEYNRSVSEGVKPTFPVIFGLAGVLFRRLDYFGGFNAAFKELKKIHLGEDIPMHEYDLRTRKKPPFDNLRDILRWNAFRDDLSSLVASCDFRIVVCAVHKPQMQQDYESPFHPYNYALDRDCYCWRAMSHTEKEGEKGRRGPKPDGRATLSFRIEPEVSELLASLRRLTGMAPDDIAAMIFHMVCHDPKGASARLEAIFSQPSFEARSKVVSLLPDSGESRADVQLIRPEASRRVEERK